MQTIEFIGGTLDSVRLRAYLLMARFHTMSNLIDQVMYNPQTSFQSYLSLLGHIVSWTYLIPFLSLHLHCLQAWLWTVYIPSKHIMNITVTIPARMGTSITGGKIPSKCVCMYSFPIPHTWQDVKYGCLYNRLGILHWYGLGHLDAQETRMPRDQNAHQSSGTLGCLRDL